MGAGALVLGASGYAGGELLRLLAGHPGISVVGASAARRAGDPIAAALPHLTTEPRRFVPVEELDGIEADVCFSCLPEGPPEPFTRSCATVIDLSRTNRHHDGWTYGLTELARPAIRDASALANPGCYPTAVLLALVPFALAGAVTPPVVVDAMSGASGAGRRDDASFSLAELAGDAKAYGSVSHDHVGEMERGLARLGGFEAQVSFTPHLVPLSRGLVITARARLAPKAAGVDPLETLTSMYSSEPFVHVVDDWPGAKSVAGTNRALVSARVDRRAGWLIASCAIDNLGKGAAGQAIQNANVRLGLEETSGLTAFGVWP